MRSESSEVRTPGKGGRIQGALGRLMKRRKARQRRAALESLEARELLATLPAPIVQNVNLLAPRGNDSAPSVSVDPTNPLKAAMVWVRNDPQLAPGPQVIAQGAYTIDGGTTWNTFALPGQDADPNTTNPVVPYAQGTDVSVAYDRTGRFYVLVSQHNAANTSGALFLSKYDFVGDQPRALYTNAIVERWVPATDLVTFPTLAVDVSAPTYTDPTTGQVHSNPNAGTVYVAWTSTDVAPANPPNPFNPSRIKLMSLTGDATAPLQNAGTGGDRFAEVSGHAIVNDPGNFGDQRNGRARIVVSPGRADGAGPAPGTVTVVWDDFGTLATSNPPLGILWSDAVSAGQPDYFHKAGYLETSLPIGNAAGLRVADLNVTLNLTHQSLNQVRAVLVAPDGTEVPLFAGLNGGVLFATTFDDESATSIVQATGTRTGSFRPASALSRLRELPVNGNWRLRLYDYGGGSTGTLLGWSLNVTPQGQAARVYVASAVNVPIPDDTGNPAITDAGLNPTPNFAAPTVYATNPSPAVATGVSAVVLGNFQSGAGLDIITANPTSGQIGYLVNNGTGGFAFATQPNAPAGLNPVDVAGTNLFGSTADLDVVVANDTAPGAMNLLENLAGGGTFINPTVRATGNRTVAVASGDFNQDGRDDQVAVNFQDNTVQVFPFGGSTITLTADLNGPIAVVATDLNRDGKLDLVVLNSGNETLKIFQNNTAAGGTVSFQTNLAPVAIEAGAVGLAAADFNNDFYNDLVVLHQSGLNRARIYQTTTATPGGAIAVAASTALAVPGVPVAVAAGELSFDVAAGRVDIAVVYRGPGLQSRVAVFRNLGGLQFTSPTIINATPATPAFPGDGLDPTDIAVGNLDGAGVDDIVVTSRGGRGTVTVLLSQANASTAATSSFPVQVEIANPGSITDLDVSVSLTHPALAELEIALRAPDGSRIILQRNQVDAAGTVISAAIGNTGANLGLINGNAIGTIFDDDATRRIVDINATGGRGAAAPFAGHFRPETGSLDAFVQSVLAANGTLDGAWTLEVTDVKSAGATPPLAFLNDLSLRFTSGLVEGNDTVATITTMRGNAPVGSAVNQGGIYPDVALAADNTLGSFSPFQGRVYLSYVDRDDVLGNPADNTDVFLMASDDGGQTWTALADARNPDGVIKVHQDHARRDGYSEGESEFDAATTGRPQLQPQLAVDPVTGTLVISWLDARHDAARGRVATYLTTSIDGGRTLGAEEYVNPKRTAYDTITGKEVAVEPLLESGTIAADGLFGLGQRYGLTVAGGRIYASWASNQLGDIDGKGVLNIRTASATIAAGPRIVSSTMGPIGGPGDLVNVRRTADGTPILDGFEVVFDRPIDPATFRPDDVRVYFRDTTIGDATGVSIPILDVIPIPTPPAWFDDAVTLGVAADERFPDQQYNPGNRYGYTRFLVKVAPRSSVGTYSYTIGSGISDRVRSDLVVPAQTATYQPVASQQNLRVPAQFTGGTNSGAFDTTTSAISVPAPVPGTGRLVTGIRVGVTIQHPRPSDLVLTLVAPDGRSVLLSEFNGTYGSNYINTVFDDAAEVSISNFGAQPPFTGSFRPQEVLAFLNGQQAEGNWTLVVQDLIQGTIGTLQTWTLELETGDVVTGGSPGNALDQDHDATTGEGAINLGGLGDVYAVPRPTSTGGAFQYSLAQGALGPYANDMLPLVISGPRIVGTQLANSVASVTTFTSTYDQSSLPVPPAFNGGTDTFRDVTRSTIEVQGIRGGLTLQDLEVTINLSHPRASDLTLILVAPDGTEVPLAYRRGGAGAGYVNTTFHDRAPSTIGETTTPFTGTFRPEGALAQLFGRSPNGTWSLRIIDGVAGAGTAGTLQSWSLKMTTDSPDNLALDRTVSAIDVTFDRDMVTQTVTSADVLRVVGPAGAVVKPYTFAPSATQVNRVIPDTAAGVLESTLLITDAAGLQISDLNLVINLAHDRLSDLTIELVAPDGTKATVVSGLVGANLVGTVLDDEATFTLGSGSAPYTGSFRPTGALSTFDGKLLQGAWRLRVTDRVTGMVGTLNSWSMQAATNIRTYASTTPNVPVPDFGPTNPMLNSAITINDAAGLSVADLNVTVELNHSRLSDLSAQLIAPDGTVVPLFASLPGANLTGTVFDDEAARALGAGTAPFTGLFRPVGNLSLVDGKPVNGTWRLRVTDTVSGVTGVLRSWSMQVTSDIRTYQQGTPQTIPGAASGELVSTLVITDPTNFSIADLNVRLDVADSDLSDLSAELIAPDGTTVELFRGLAGANLTGLVLDDQAAVAATAGTAPFTGRFRPTGSLGAFNGKDLRGTWTLRLRDDRIGDAGTLLGWSLEGTPEARVSAAYNVVAADRDRAIPDDGSGTPVLVPIQIADDGGAFRIADLNVRLDITHARSQDLRLTLIAPDGTRVPLFANIGGAANKHFRDTVLDDQAAASIATGATPYNASYRPAGGTLAALNGKQLRGTWALEVVDTAAGNGTTSGGQANPAGVVHAWSLEAVPQASSLAAARTFRVSFPTQSQSGTYVVSIGPEVSSLVGDRMDSDSNAGVSLLTGRVVQTSAASAVHRFDPQITPVVIPDAVPGAGGQMQPGVLVSPFTISNADDFRIADLSVNLDISHSRTSDLRIELIAPDGTVVTLATGQAGRDFRDTTFSDGALVPISASNPRHTGTFRPATPLSSTIGKALNGTWYLRITDNQYGGGQAGDPNPGPNTLNSWSLVATPQSVDTTYVSTDVNKPTSDVNLTVSSLPVAADFLIGAVALTLDLSHPNVSALRLFLEGPDGTRVKLFDRAGVSGSLGGMRGTTFDDRATTLIQDSSAPFFAGSYKPQEPLGAFTGLSAAGTWRLIVEDTATGQTGTLQGWRLTFQRYLPSTGLGEPVADRAEASFRIFTMDPTNPQSSTTWTAVGPAGILDRPLAIDAESDAIENAEPGSRTGYAGRVSSIAVDPSDPSGNTVYAAAASGGIWKTTNFLTADTQGPTWMPLTDFGPTFGLNISSITVVSRNNDPNQSIVVAATGEAAALTGEGSTSNPASAGSTSRGIGFLRSMDGGATWTLLDSTNNSLPSAQRDHLFAASGGHSIYRVVSDATPTIDNQYILYAAVAGPNGGLWRSDDTGTTWVKKSVDAVHGTVATDVLIDTYSKSASTGNADIIYAAFAGRGVYQSPNRGEQLNQMTGQVGVPLIRDPSVFPSRGIAVDTLPSPNSLLSTRVTLAKPAPVPSTDPNAVVKNLLYQGWLYAAVAGPFGTLDSLYLTKDYGQTWTDLQLPNTQRTNTGRPVNPSNPSNNPNLPDYDAADGGGNARAAYNLTLVVDPNDPNVVYLGGSSLNSESGLIRVDATAVFDAHAFMPFTTTQPAGGNLASTEGSGRIDILNTNDPLPFVYSDTEQTGFFARPRRNYLNMVVDPNRPFDVNATIFVFNVDSFSNSGEGVKWTPIDTTLPYANDSFRNTATAYDSVLKSKAADGTSASAVHGAISYRDPVTGLSRLVFATEQGVFTGALRVDGTIDDGAGSAASATYSRNGNLQITQFFSGAVQPNTLAAQIGDALLYGSSWGVGFPKSDADLLTSGNIQWQAPYVLRSDGLTTNIDGYGTNGELVGSGAATDQQGTGTSYLYRWPGYGNVITDFFAVNGVSRTSGLYQTPVGVDPQWGTGGPVYAGAVPLGRFAVNPLNGNQAVISSNAGRIFGTANQGRAWFVIGDPAALDGTYAPAMAFGAPLPNSPGGGNLNNFIYAGTVAGNVFVTTTGGGAAGNVWTRLPAPDGSSVVSIVTSPDRGTRAVYAETLNGVYYMPDSLAAGATWTNITGNLFSIQQQAFGDADLTSARLSFLTSLTADWRYSIPADPTTPAGPTSSQFPVLYAAGDNGVYRSLNNGATWSLFPSATDGADVDGGLLPSVHVTDLDLAVGRIDPNTGRPIVDATAPNLLVATTYGRGAFAIRVAPQVFTDSLRFAVGSDSGTSTSDRVTSVRNPVIEGLSVRSAFGNSVTLELVDMTDPTNPVVVGQGRTDQYGNFEHTDSTGQVLPGLMITGNLSDGEKLIGIQATDLAGTKGNIAEFRFTLDTLAPATLATSTGLALQGTSDSPTVGAPGFVYGVTDRDLITNATPLAFDLTTTEPDTTVLTLLRDGKAVATRTGTGVMTDSSSFAQDGVFTYSVQLEDLAGNTSVSDVKLAVTLDRTAPLVPPAPSLSPSPFEDTGSIGDNITANPRPLLIGTAEPRSTVQLLNGGGQVLSQVVVPDSGTYELRPAAGLVDGVNTLQVRSIDTAGNISPLSTTRSVTVLTKVPDTPGTSDGRPTIALVQVDNSGDPNDNVTNVVRPRFQGLAPAGLYVELIDAATNTVLTDLPSRPRVAPNGTYVIQPTLLKTFEGNPPRDYRLKARVSDEAGNIVESTELTIRVDTQAPGNGPAVSLLLADDTGIPTDRVTVKRRPTFVGTTEPRAVVELVRVDVALAPGQSYPVVGTTTAGPTGNFTVQLANNLVNGTIRLAARIRDVAGNQGSLGTPLTVRIITVDGDYDNDGKADPTTFQASTGLWSIEQSSFGKRYATLGQAGDVPVLGDFDGDGQADPAVFRAGTSLATWQYLPRGGSSPVSISWGLAGDIPVTADFDGDGLTDFGVFRPNAYSYGGAWYVLPRSGPVRIYDTVWGQAGDIPVPADYDGDRKADLAVFRPSESKWYIWYSNGGVLMGAPYGLAGDVPVPGDYTGPTGVPDGHADIGVFRPSESKWYVPWWGPSGVAWGLKGDVPVPADYNGDGGVDFAVYRPSTGEYHVANSGLTAAPKPGQANDLSVFGPLSHRRPATAGTVRVASVGVSVPVTTAANTSTASTTPNLGQTASKLSTSTSTTANASAQAKSKAQAKAAKAKVVAPVATDNLGTTQRLWQRLRRGGRLRG